MLYDPLHRNDRFPIYKHIKQFRVADSRELIAVEQRQRKWYVDVRRANQTTTILLTKYRAEYATNNCQSAFLLVHNVPHSNRAHGEAITVQHSPFHMHYMCLLLHKQRRNDVRMPILNLFRILFSVIFVVVAGYAMNRIVSFLFVAIFIIFFPACVHW